jgi:hypothetical protein
MLYKISVSSAFITDLKIIKIEEVPLIKILSYVMYVSICVSLEQK